MKKFGGVVMALALAISATSANASTEWRSDELQVFAGEALKSVGGYGVGLILGSTGVAAMSAGAGGAVGWQVMSKRERSHEHAGADSCGQAGQRGHKETKGKSVQKVELHVDMAKDMQQVGLKAVRVKSEIGPYD